MKGFNKQNNWETLDELLISIDKMLSGLSISKRKALCSGSGKRV